MCVGPHISSGSGRPAFSATRAFGASRAFATSAIAACSSYRGSRVDETTEAGNRSGAQSRCICHRHRSCGRGSYLRAVSANVRGKDIAKCDGFGSSDQNTPNAGWIFRICMFRHLPQMPPVHMGGPAQDRRCSKLCPILRRSLQSRMRGGCSALLH